MASGPLRERAAGQLGGTLDELPLRIRMSSRDVFCFDIVCFVSVAIELLYGKMRADQL